ncbi:MAG: segregation/condensation protein A [Verrucomicrobiales bacterium]|nr:segregation/condensation protein A [Verrucomicrobiales bacterium]
MGEYRVRFEVFEGPLDLLLYLIRKEEVDIYEVNLTRIATEFVDYLNLMRELDLDVAGEFVVMAATLMLIKSRELLPKDQRPEIQNGEEEDMEDPRWELIRQLVEYKKFKDAAARLQEFEYRAENTFPRVPGRVELPEEAPSRRSDATIFDLLSAVNAVLQRFAKREGEARDVFEDRWSVSEKIELLLNTVREKSAVRFSELFHAATSRTEVVVTFLAILELVRLRMIVAAQPEAFADIQIELAPQPAAPDAAPPEPTANSASPSDAAVAPPNPEAMSGDSGETRTPTSPDASPSADPRANSSEPLPPMPPETDTPGSSRWN